MKTNKIALLGSLTFDPLIKEANNYLAPMDLIPEWYIAPFNQYKQEVLDENSGLRKFQPNIIFLALDEVTVLESRPDLIDFLKHLSSILSTSTIVVLNIPQLLPEPLSLLEFNRKNSMRINLLRTNISLSNLVQTRRNLKVLDIEKPLSDLGLVQAYDPRLYYLAKIPFSQSGQEVVGREMAKAILAILGKRKKCLVLDLDNTLWGGILGEEGAEHIKLSNDGLGKAFYDFQKILKSYQKSGILLTIVSKNDYDTAMDVIKNHPFMVLRENDFAAVRINWEPKSKNIVSIGEELSLNTDSFVFLDDSPQERELVINALPEVAVPDLPEDFSYYPAFLAGLAYFETFVITEEDEKRSKLYHDEKKRSVFKSKSYNLSQFLISLKMEAQIREIDSFSLPRIAQLTQKTNQFNLTTRRYEESDLKMMGSKKRYKIYYLNAQDKFGDMGIVGVAIVDYSTESARLDTFLMSCRVLGRGLEDLFLLFLFNSARKKGAKLFEAEFIPSGKNKMAENFLPSKGFKRVIDFWTIDLRTSQNKYPDWIKMR